MKFLDKLFMIKKNIIAIQEKYGLEYDITNDTNSEYSCFVSNDKYILECVVQEATGYAPYYQVMFALAEVETGNITYWYDTKESNIEDLKNSLDKMLAHFIR